MKVIYFTKNMENKIKLIGDVKSIGNSIMIQAVNLLNNIEDGKYTIELKKYHKGRSLNQNAYFWKLVSEIAIKENGCLSDIDSIYSNLLKLSGAKYEVLYMKEEAFESLKKNEIIRHCLVVKRQVVNNQAMITALIFYGSSNFDTKEMSNLIDVTLKYASEIGVEHVDDYWKGLLND